MPTISKSVLTLLFLSAPALAQEITSIPLQTRDLAYDPVSRKIYGSVPGAAGPDGNSVVILDPFTQAVGPFVPIGSEPGDLARSDDGQYLYVGLNGSAAVRRFIIATRTAELQFSLGTGTFGPNGPEDIAVQPGNPNVVAVSLRRPGVSPRHGGVAIFDNGVRRPTVTPEHTGSNVIEWSAVPGTLYGFNNETTEFGFRRMLVNASGVQTVNTFSTAIVGFNVDIAFHQGVVYATNGAAIDPETGASLGSYPGVFFASAVAADALQDRVYFLSNNEIQVYRLSNFTFLETITVPGVVGTSRSLIRWGGSGLAFRTDSQVFLISEEPVRQMAVAPRAGDVLVTQAFDVALTITAPGTTVTGIASGSVDGVDITALLRGSAVPGLVDAGELTLATLRFPSLGAKIGERFGAGAHTLAVAVDLADGLTIPSEITWNFVDVIENPARHGPVSARH